MDGGYGGQKQARARSRAGDAAPHMLVFKRDPPLLSVSVRKSFVSRAMQKWSLPAPAAGMARSGMRVVQGILLRDGWVGDQRAPVAVALLVEVRQRILAQEMDVGGVRAIAHGQ